jgi:hypothetical protein
VTAGYEVITGDSGEVLEHFEEGSIDAIVTDPPFGLYFMQSDWDANLPSQRIFDECFRVLKPGGHIFVMSSERLDCIAGFYHLLANAGFEVDNHQLIGWLTLSGMPKSSDVAKTADKEAFRAWLTMHREFVPCPDHKEPKNPETGEKQRCVECERIFCEGNLTRHDQRKAASAAVNGDFRDNPNWRPAKTRNGRGFDSLGEEPLDNTEDLSILDRLLASHWPASPDERRAQWEACVEEVPADWDCSRPPGVRVKTGVREYERSPFNAKGTIKRESEVLGKPECDSVITAPSTPDAVRFDGWRGSVAPMKPMLAPILHACKPWRGSYLDCARESGGGVLNMDEARIPFAGEGDTISVATHTAEAHNASPCYGDSGGDWTTGPHAAGRVPGNLLSYGDLLADLQRYADLSAWCEKLGLPASAAELLEAGLVYAPKPSASEKRSGLLQLRADLSEQDRAEATRLLREHKIVPAGSQ